MSWFNRLTVRVCILLFTLILGVFGLLYTFMDYSVDSQRPRLEEHLVQGRDETTRTEVARSALDMAIAVGQLLAVEIETESSAQIRRTIRSIARDQWIRQVSLYDTDGRLIYEVRPKGVDYHRDENAAFSLRKTSFPLYRLTQDGLSVNAWAPVWGDEERLGTMMINRVVREHSLTADTLEAQVMQVWNDLSHALLNGLTRGGGMALLLTMVLVLMLSREISRPYRRLEQAFEGLRSGRRVRLRTNEGPSEARRLSDRFNAMASALESANDKVRELAFTDNVTQLPNRAAVMERIDQVLESGAPAALLFVDLDDFKRVNDVFGHDVGDETLVTVANRLRHVMRTAVNGGRPIDLVARLGGDEFVVLLSPPPEPDHLKSISERMIASLCEVIEIGNRDIFIGASIGIAMAPNQGSKADTLLRHADMAMYEAKNHGKRQAAVFDCALERDAKRMSEVEQHLRSAIAKDQLRVEYQPILNGDSVTMGYEALVRWTSPELGEVSPGEFIPVAEAYGMIEELDLWIAKTALMEMSKHVSPSGIEPFLSLNMSGQHFVAGQYTQRLLQIMDLIHLEPSRLHIEITETALLRDEEKALEIVTQLRDAGIKVFLDDFGTGYSSLSHLANFQLDGLKIDVSFVQAIPDKPGAMSLTAGLISLAHNLDLEVVAEGVETEAQRQFLVDNDCDYLQGWLFAKAGPLPASELAQEVG